MTVSTTDLDTIQAALEASGELCMTCCEDADDIAAHLHASLIAPLEARIAELEAENASMKSALRPFAEAQAYWASQFNTSEVMREPASLNDLWRKANGRKAIPQITADDLNVALDCLNGDPRGGDRGGQFGWQQRTVDLEKRVGELEAALKRRDAKGGDQ